MDLDLLVEAVVYGDAGARSVVDALHVGAEVGAVAIPVPVPLGQKQKGVDHLMLGREGKGREGKGERVSMGVEHTVSTKEHST